MSLTIENNNHNLINTPIFNDKNKCNNRTKIKLKNNNNKILKIKKIIKPTCSICLEEMELKDAVKVKNCGHMFHKNCISEWIELRNTCPLCRSVIKKKFVIYETKYKGLYKSHKRIFINDDYFYIFKYNDKNKEKNKKINNRNTMLELFNSNNKNYIYHYLLSIVRIQFKGKKMIINIAIDKNTNKILKFYFKNVIDSQNCFKLINDNIKKKKKIIF